jgi:hypothetical protein
MAKCSQTRFLVRAISGAQPLKVMPGFIEPALATLRSSPPPGDRWIHEIKFDGYRVQAHVVRSSAILYTKGGHNWTHRFRTITAAVSHLPAERMILDGEVIVDMRLYPVAVELDLVQPVVAGRDSAARSVASSGWIKPGITPKGFAAGGSRPKHRTSSPKRN